MKKKPTLAEETLRELLPEAAARSDDDARLAPSADAPRETAALAGVWAELGLAAKPELLPAKHRARLLLAALGQKRFSPPIRSSLQRLYELSDTAVEALIARMNQAGAWHPTPMPGLDILALEGAPSLSALTRGADRIELLGRFAPGTPFPHHAHLGDERVLVLEGGFTTNDGRQVRAGETLFMPSGSAHSFVADEGEECIAATRLLRGVRFI